jgi:hypothetical protein
VKGGAIPAPKAGIRAIWVDGADGKRYGLIANFTSQRESLTLSGEAIELDAHTALVKTDFDTQEN